ncbi:MAG: hypothetical protein KDJ38_13940 [Gammaproteobacteria bacterium]|nr:hypothetical protein [Gammaproteobacteria bacterium]
MNHVDLMCAYAQNLCMRLHYKILLLLLIVMSVSACAVSSGERIRRIAEDKQMIYGVEKAEGFSLAVFSNRVPLADDKILHVYLEGDGAPWQFRYFVSPDPTPRRPLMLELMALDHRAAVYVGRPCYNGFSDEPACGPALWTTARHSQTVVGVMSRAIEQLATRIGADTIHLYGHSGGGAMAVLIAGELRTVDAVLTIAGNLDLDAWTSLHGYTPLYGSLNPAAREPLNPAIRQIHLLGAKDCNFPPEIVLEWIRSQQNSQYFIFDEFSHGCCWEKAWPTMLDYMDNGFVIPAVRESRLFPGQGPLHGLFARP